MLPDIRLAINTVVELAVCTSPRSGTSIQSAKDNPYDFYIHSSPFNLPKGTLRMSDTMAIRQLKV